MAEVVENHALIKCPHCNGMIRVKARTLKGKTVEDAMHESKWGASILPKWFRDIFGVFK